MLSLLQNIFLCDRINKTNVCQTLRIPFLSHVLCGVALRWCARIIAALVPEGGIINPAGYEIVKVQGSDMIAQKSPNISTQPVRTTSELCPNIFDREICTELPRDYSTEKVGVSVGNPSAIRPQPVGILSGLYDTRPVSKCRSPACCNFWIDVTVLLHYFSIHSSILRNTSMLPFRMQEIRCCVATGNIHFCY